MGSTPRRMSSVSTRRFCQASGRLSAAAEWQHDFAGNIGADADHLEVHDGADLVVVRTRGIDLRPLLNAPAAPSSIDFAVCRTRSASSSASRSSTAASSSRSIASIRLSCTASETSSKTSPSFRRRQDAVTAASASLRQHLECRRRPLGRNSLPEAGAGRQRQGAARGRPVRRPPWRSPAAYQAVHQAVNWVHIGEGSLRRAVSLSWFRSWSCSLR